MFRGLRSCSRGVVGFVAAYHGVRTFSSSSVLHKKINLAPFTKPSGGLEPTSSWKLPQLEQFCDWAFQSGLRFTKDQLEAITLLPAQIVFARCSAGRDDIMARKYELDMTGVPVEDRSLVERDVKTCFAGLERALFRYVDPLPEAKPKEKKLDMLAATLAILCGFHDGKNFLLDAESIEFKLAGTPINSEADVYVASRRGAPGQLVLIWEEKLSREQKSNLTAPLLQDTAAQIIGEMISVHWNNKLREYKPAEVYAIRLIDDMVAFFRMEMSAEQIEAVCEDGVIPNPKLQVDYVPMDALEAGDEYGVSLLHPVGRDWFVRMMACIRAEILKREVPKPGPVPKSQKAGKAPNFDDF